MKKYGKILDDYLKGRKFLVGDALTLADVSNAVFLQPRGPARPPGQELQGDPALVGVARPVPGVEGDRAAAARSAAA